MFISRRVFVFLISVIILYLCEGKQGFGPGDQDWGYVTVREKAHMFWWLYHTTASNDSSERPLIIWLQGGPGGSSTGIGNFQEIGPLTLEQQTRPSAWTKFANILFVDNPVGTGFSYVEDKAFLATNNKEIAEDFYIFLKKFFDLHPKLANVPLYIFGQSYGGKMAVDIALHIIERSEKENSQLLLQGIGLGDAWISPMDSLKSWSPYLLNLGFVDQSQASLLNVATNFGQSLYDNNLFANVTKTFIIAQMLVRQYAGKLNFYNVMSQFDAQDYLKTNSQDLDFVLPSLSDDIALDQLMNNQVAAALNLKQKWGDQSDAVFEAVEGDFMKSVTKGVETILNETDLTVTIYNGQLDLIVPTIGTEKWVENLKWKGTESWKNGTDGRSLFTPNGIVEGYEKIVGNLQFYWVNRAGHSVPADNPRAMEYILRKATNDFTVNIKNNDNLVSKS